MALIFNGLKPRGVSIMNYGYSYGSYGYGYGYGYGGGGDGYGYYTVEESKSGWKNAWGLGRKMKAFFRRK